MALRAAKMMTPISDAKSASFLTPVMAFSPAILLAVPLIVSPAFPLAPKPAISAGNARGFTLLELLMVMSIIAMASILVVPNLGGLDSRTFNAQTRQAVSLLNHARRTAVVSGQASTIRFNADLDDENEADTQTAGFSSNDSNLEDRAQRFRANIVGEWNSSGIDIRFRDSTDREEYVEDRIEVTFYPEGGSTGGVLLLAQEERELQLIVDPFTGRISSEESEE
jgi:general secretion pathway protein H